MLKVLLILLKCKEETARINASKLLINANNCLKTARLQQG
jgi:hypothetical protein